ncbi:MAG: metal-dependent phosphohydrolase [Pseudanabaenaceae cyanobacterium]|jgi:hypothetical protein
MSNTPKSQIELIYSSIKYIVNEYSYIYHHKYQEFSNLFREISLDVLKLIMECDAPYHNLEHTLQVILVGQEIVSGRHICHETLSPGEWLNFMVGLLCHDIGYLKGICTADQPECCKFTTGNDDQVITISATATGASLSPYHVDRSKLFVAERLNSYDLLDVEAIQLSIELTRFPVPKNALYEDTVSLAGLARGADLIGQLSDPSYLTKLPMLFAEFAEIGSHQVMGYHDPNDLRAGYPKFYWHCVSTYLTHSIRYLEVSKTGRAILSNLYRNRIVVEREMDRLYSINRNPLKRLVNYLVR